MSTKARTSPPASSSTRSHKPPRVVTQHRLQLAGVAETELPQQGSDRRGRVHAAEQGLHATRAHDVEIVDAVRARAHSRDQRGQFRRRVRRPGLDPRRDDTTFDRLVDQVMTTEPYASAHRVFWVVDNGSSQRGQASIDRLQACRPTLRLIHLPVHASWLNQVEINFSDVQRKVVSPNDFHTLDEVKSRLHDFQQ